MQEPITLEEVAKAAGVSVATVHRVMANKRHVSTKTAMHVKKIANQMGYTVKRSPSSQEFAALGSCFKTHTIGLLLIDRPIDLLNQPLNTRLLAHIESALAKYKLLMTIVQVPDTESFPEVISKQRMDGTIIIGASSSKNLQASLKDISSVALLAGKQEWTDWVTSDFQARGELAARYLADRGHKSIAYINYVPGHAGFISVAKSFESEAASLGIKSHIFMEDRYDRWEQAGDHMELMDRLIEQILSLPESERPTGLHVANDGAAVDAYTSLRKHGLEPMKDIDIISCDNDESYLLRLSPRPATMDLNTQAIAERAVETLLFNIRYPDSSRGIKIMVPPILIKPATDVYMEKTDQDTL